MKLKNLLPLWTIVGVAMLASCQKDEGLSDNEQISQDESLMDEMSNTTDVLVDLNIGGDQESVAAIPMFKATSTTYPIVEVSFPNQTLWPRDISIDFGPSNLEVTVGNPAAENPHKVLVRGKILIVQSGPHLATGSERTIDYDGFYLNNYHIEGSANYVNNGLNNNNNNYEFSWVATLKVTATDGYWVSRSVSKVREMVAGASTPLVIWDDAFLVNGTAVGENSKGWSYSHVLNDVLVKRTCRFPVSGTIDVENSLTSFVMDYGTGDCDNLATLTGANGNVTTVKLDRY